MPGVSFEDDIMKTQQRQNWMESHSCLSAAEYRERVISTNKPYVLLKRNV